MVAFTDPVEKMVEMYLKVKPTVIYGNKTHLVQIALYCDLYKIELPKPRICISFAETMDERSRAVIEKCFGAESLMQILRYTSSSTTFFILLRRFKASIGVTLSKFTLFNRLNKRFSSAENKDI